MELVGWDQVADKLQRSVRDAQEFVAENPSFPLIRNGKGSPVRASILLVEKWLADYHAAYVSWRNSQHWEVILAMGGRFIYRPSEPPEIQGIKARSGGVVKRRETNK